LPAMSPSASVAFEFVRVQKDSESSGPGVNCTTSLEFGPGKQLAKPRLQDMSRIKPQMMQKVLSSIALSEDKQGDLAHVNHRAKSFSGRSEASSHAEMMELFPVCTGFGSSNRVTERNTTRPFAISQTDPVSRSVPAKTPEQQSTGQFVIFYNGMVNVYNVPAEKGEAIIRLAGSISSSKTRIPQIDISKIQQILKPLHHKPASNADNEDQPERLPVGLQIVPKLSVQRFLQKRTERINRVSPYTTMKPATLPSKARKDSDDQIILSLACSSY